MVSMVRIAAEYFTQASNEDKKKIARKILNDKLAVAVTGSSLDRLDKE